MLTNKQKRFSLNAMEHFWRHLPEKKDFSNPQECYIPTTWRKTPHRLIRYEPQTTIWRDAVSRFYGVEAVCRPIFWKVAVKRLPEQCFRTFGKRIIRWAPNEWRVHLHFRLEFVRRALAVLTQTRSTMHSQSRQLLATNFKIYIFSKSSKDSLGATYLRVK